MTERVDRPPSEAVARRIKAACADQGITAAQLAERCAELGASTLTRDAIASITSGRRRVDVDELVQLGAALNISPLLLLLPFGDADRVEVTPTIAVPTRHVLGWFEGLMPLLRTDLTARLDPWPEAPDWFAAAAQLHLYRDLYALQRDVTSARGDAARKEALDRLREYVEVGMRRAGFDERAVLEQYEEL